MSRIQRWELRNGFRGEDAYKHEDGPYVWYMDHLRAVTLAKIEVLEEENGEADTAKWRQAKIAALRKELEG